MKWSARPFNQGTLEQALRELSAKPAPPLPSRLSSAQIIRALFVPTVASKGHAAKMPDGSMVITAADLLEVGR